MRLIPYGRQTISREDIEAVVTALDAEMLTRGPLVERFEKAVASHCGAGFGVAANSATSALHLACLALGLGPGDLLWTSPNTFVASANSARYCGADVDFVDIDPRTCNMSISALRARLEEAERAGRLPDIVMPVHFAGQSCDMCAIRKLANQYRFRIIEDASHAIGAQYAGAPVGSCSYADITVFSFHPVKIITTGEGGMAVTNHPDLAERMRRLRCHGITRHESLMDGAREGAWYYQQLELGFNYNLTDIQAALGLSQLQRLAEFVEQRRSMAANYDHLLQNLPLVRPWQHPDTRSSFHLYVVRLQLERIPVTRAQVFKGLRAAGIGVNVHYIPVHTQPYYRQLGFRSGEFPEAERYYAEALTLPLHPQLTQEQQQMVVRSLRECLL